MKGSFTERAERDLPDNSNVNISHDLYRGVVENNNDPYRIGRVQVRVPSLHGVPEVTATSIPSSKLPWAPICSLSAGQGRGTVLTPMVGDTVFVLFEQGRKDRPVVMGCCYSTGADTGSKFTGSTSSMFKNNGGISETVTDMSDIPNDARKGDSNQILYKSVKGAQIGFKDRDGGEMFQMTDRIGQVIELGTDAPSGTQARPQGDRSRPGTLPQDSFYEKGYMHMQIASTHQKDSGMHMTEDLVNAVNGTSILNMDKDHVTLSNMGGEAVSIQNRPQDPTDSERATTNGEVEAVQDYVGGMQGQLESISQALTSEVQTMSGITKGLGSFCNTETLGTDKLVSSMSRRVGAMTTMINSITKDLGSIDQAIGSLGNIKDLKASISGLASVGNLGTVLNVNAMITGAFTSINNITDKLGSMKSLTKGIENIANLASNSSLGQLGNMTNLGNLSSLKSSLGNMSGSIGNVTGNLGSMTSGIGNVSAVMSSQGGTVDIKGDQVLISNSGCFIKMLGPVMQLQATQIVMKAPGGIFLN